MTPAPTLSQTTKTAIAYELAARGLGWEDLRESFRRMGWKLSRDEAREIVLGRKG